MTFKPGYAPGDFITFQDDKKLKTTNMRKKYQEGNGACLYMYTSQDNKKKLISLKEYMGCKNWDQFITKILEYVRQDISDMLVVK